MEDGAWMLWENSSVAVVAVIVAHPGLGEGKKIEAAGVSHVPKSCPGWPLGHMDVYVPRSSFFFT